MEIRDKIRLMRIRFLLPALLLGAGLLLPVTTPAFAKTSYKAKKYKVKKYKGSKRARSHKVQHAKVKHTPVKHIQQAR